MEKEKQLKNLVIGLAVVAVVLVAVLSWIWVDRSKMIGELTVEKDSLTVQMVQLKTDYEGLSTNNTGLNAELTKEKEKVDQLIDRVKKTDATNKSKLRQYEKELGTLRSIMRGYIIQIDSLNTLNNHLRKETAVAKDEAKDSKQKFQDLQSTTDEYAKQVQIGSVLKGRGITTGAITSANKDTDRSSRTAKLKTCLNLVENSIAVKGPRKVYLRVKSPDGILMTGSQQQIFTVNGEQMVYSAVREVDYQGSELEVCIFFTNNIPFVKGVYTVDVFTEEGKMGTSDLLLR